MRLAAGEVRHKSGHDRRSLLAKAVPDWVGNHRWTKFPVVKAALLRPILERYPADPRDEIGGIDARERSDSAREAAYSQNWQLPSMVPV